MSVATFNHTSSLVALGILALAAAMLALGWLFDRRRTVDGIFALQATGAALAFPGYELGVGAPLGAWEVPFNVVVTGLTALGAAEFTRVHLGRRPQPLLRWGAWAAVTVALMAAALGEIVRVSVPMMLAYSWACLGYTIGALRPLLGRGRESANAWVLLAAWGIVAVASTPHTLRLLGIADLLDGLNPLPAGAAMFASLHAFVLVAERARSSRELEQLDAELRRQIRKRADELAEGAARLLAALEGPSTEPPPLDSTVDERYRLEQILGRGGMGVVYAARSPQGAQVALKVLRQRPHATSVARFAREARIAARVRHPNVVQVRDLGLTRDGLMYLVLEYVDGPTLDTLVRRPPEVPRALAIAAGIVEGLAAIHDLGIVHRDLKPSNVLLAGGDRPMITDFGIAALAERPDDGGRPVSTAEADADETRLTLSNQAIGTPAYMAPEQLHGREPTNAADIYALCIILAELVVGKRRTITPGRALADLDDAAHDRLDAALGAPLAGLIRAALGNPPDGRPSISQLAEAVAAKRHDFDQEAPRRARRPAG